MREMLETVVFADYTVKDLLLLAGAAVVVMMFVRLIRRVFRKKDDGRYVQSVECFHCGWKGRVSRLAGRCPKCNRPLGDRTLQGR